MVIDVRHYEEFPARAFIKAADGEIAADFDFIVSINEVTCNLLMHKSGEEYFCKGEFESDVMMECARCLRQFRANLKNVADFTICPEGLHDDDNAIDDEDYVYLDNNGHTADMRNIARQSIILAMDISPLCTEDCKGLCLTCKANLNDGPCKCQQVEQ
jgi:uncharacterized protein